MNADERIQFTIIVTAAAIAVILAISFALDTILRGGSIDALRDTLVAVLSFMIGNHATPVAKTISNGIRGIKSNGNGSDKQP